MTGESTSPSNSQSGAALLSVLMIVAAMSVAAVIAVSAVTQATQLARVTTDRTDGFWQVRSAEIVSAALIDELMSRTAGRVTQRTPGLGEALVFPLEGGGAVSAIARDTSNCFNLNALAVRGDGGWQIDDGALGAFKTLLIAAGLTEYDGDRLADSLADWMDSDSISRSNGAEDAAYLSLDPSYRTPGAPLENIRELRSIAPYTPDLYALVSSLACVRPTTEQSVLNVNTLTETQSPLLIALFAPDLEATLARRLLELRPTGGWNDTAEMMDTEILRNLAGAALLADRVSVQSNHFVVTGNVRMSAIVNRFELLYAIDRNGQATLVWRRYGED